MTKHRYDPNGHIVDAFIKHLEKMTEDEWLAVGAAWSAEPDAERDAVWDAEPDAERDAAWYAVWDAVWDHEQYAERDAVWSAEPDAAWYAVWYAVWEIQCADLFRGRGQSFFFLPMFGFADEQAVITQQGSI